MSESVLTQEQAAFAQSVAEKVAGGLPTHQLRVLGKVERARAKRKRTLSKAQAFRIAMAVTGFNLGVKDSAKNRALNVFNYIEEMLGEAADRCEDANVRTLLKGLVLWQRAGLHELARVVEASE